MPEYVLAFLLLMAPVDEKPVCIDLEILQEVALRLELMDRHEVPYYFKNKDNYDTDVRAIRLRYIELHDAPYVQDALRFPDEQLLVQGMAFNRECHAYWKSIGEIDQAHRWETRQILVECDILYQIYDLMRDARREVFQVVFRRTCLKKLQLLLGPCYYTGEYPPCVPIWRFR